MGDSGEFLNPKSMLTPGIAGAMTVMITNTLWFQFELPLKWTGLIVSFLFGLLVLAAKGIPQWQRVIYYVLNSLIIFSMAVGTNAVGVSVMTPASQDKKISQVEITEKLASAIVYTGIPVAYAQTSTTEQEDNEISTTEKDTSTTEQDTSTTEQEKEQKQQDRSFFQPWF